MMKFKPTPPLARSYWLASLAADSDATTPLVGTQQADVLVIGGGFVGLWTALSLKQYQPDARVIVLEQDICGGGASGRNGGFVMSWWPKIATLRSFCQTDQALFLGHAAEQAISELGAFCQQHRIDADYRQQGWLWTATTAAHLGAWEGTLAACSALGVEPFERLSAAEVARRTGSSRHLGGVFERSNATVQPAALVRGMRRVALAAGVRIFEHTPVTELCPGAPVRVSTPQGQCLADSVVLATNAWSAALPALARSIVPVNSAIVVTEPMAARLQHLGWTGGESITDSQLMVDYYRTTRDGRIAFGKGTGAISYGAALGRCFSADPASLAQAEHDFRQTYPMLDDIALTHGWSGPIDRTYDSLPLFGSLGAERNIHYGIGWSGNGVGPSRLGGRILASLALGLDNAWSRCALVNRQHRRFPPEPWRYLGATLVRKAVMRKEQAEMAGREVAWVDRMLAGLAPAGLEDKP